MSREELERFAGGSVFLQAQQVFLALVAWASMGRGLITYGELADLLGYDPRAGRTLARSLGLIGHLCLLSGVPALNAIVVRGDNKQPGEAVVVTRGRSIKAEQEAVGKFPWLTVRLPSTTKFRQVAAKLASEQ